MLSNFLRCNMVKILNLTRHRATPEQVADGVIDLHDDDYRELCNLLTFTKLPTRAEVQWRAYQIASLAHAAESHLANDVGNEIRHQGEYIQHVMIDGAPFLMTELSTKLAIRYGYRVVYAFSRRVVTETTLSDGTVEKVSSFKHLGFVPSTV